MFNYFYDFLIKIIHILCKKLDWIDEDEEPMEEANHEVTVDNQAMEESKQSKTNPLIVNNRPQFKHKYQK